MIAGQSRLDPHEDGLLATAGVAVWRLAGTGTRPSWRIDWSDDADRILGASPAPALPSDLVRIVPASERTRFADWWAEVVLAPDAPPPPIEVKVADAAGGFRHLRFAAAPGGRAGTVLDVTGPRLQAIELEALRQRAEEARHAKALFLANMSHELRTPLNAVIGFAELIKAEAGESAAGAGLIDYANDISFAGRHLLDVLSDCLDFATAQAGRLALEDDYFAACDLLCDAERLLKARAAGSRIALTVELPPPSLLLRGDRRRLRQALVNLISNGVKYTAGGGTVWASLQLLADGQPCLVVSDTGVGIEAKDLPLALAPFGRVANPLTQEREGAGLGLPIARSIAELHGGNLFINSVPGVGTTAFLALPVERVLTPGGVAKPTIAGLQAFFHLDGRHVGEVVDTLDQEALDALPIGTVLLDSRGTVLRYNAAEERLAERPAELVLGRNFFREVAPCTFTPDFFGRFEAMLRDGAHPAGAVFSYVFPFPGRPTKVLVELRAGADPGTVWVLVRWA
ncbi:MAG TPA: ATP-binding protein [Azospirillaceae bacterium]|nr:ATP-binding protein [Azospirillaceae bacterium]